LTTEDGLVHNAVITIHRAPDGALWFGTWEGGVSRYDGRSFSNFTTEDGLVDDFVMTIYSEPDGVIWFGTEYGGASRYDGQGFASLTTKDGLPDNLVRAIHRASDGTLWFGTAGGVSRYDGRSFLNFTTKDGLANDVVYAIYGEPEGVIWFGTLGGVSRYDDRGQALKSPHTRGSEQRGVGDFPHFANFTTEDGLVNNRVISIYVAPDGMLWLGTRGGGVACYDGTAWTSLDTRDGLASNAVQSIHPDVDGSLWFATEGGITRYRRSTVPPKVQIVSVTTDRAYIDLDAIPACPPGTRITIEYNSIDFVTVPEKRQYRYRIYDTRDMRLETEDMRFETEDMGHKSPKSQVQVYNPPTKQTTFDWTPEEPGEYIFEVQAIDRDLNYSEPAMVGLTIQPDPMLLSMQAELNHLRREVGQKYQFGSIIGRSAGIMQVQALMERAIDSGLTVLITGETGTGKELVAKAIHHNSPRKDHPMMALNCGAVPKELITSSLFGHRKGAFTGAHEDQIGLFEAASGGTLLLDEIGEMPQDAQVQLLRVLEEHKVQRLGEYISRDVDVRIIAMTNRELMKDVAAGRFREDLYYRLSVFPIHMPPLREHSEDMPLLSERFIQEVGREVDDLSPDVFEMLQSYSWPGNVRELRNAIHRAAALAEEGKQIQIYHFPAEITQGESLIQDAVAARSGYSEAVESFQRRLVEQVLRECEGNRHEAARRLKMDRANLLRLMKRLGIP
jgi:two-component system response regulator HydG